MSKSLELAAQIGRIVGKAVANEKQYDLADILGALEVNKAVAIDLRMQMNKGEL